MKQIKMYTRNKYEKKVVNFIEVYSPPPWLLEMVRSYYLGQGTCHGSPILHMKV